MSDEVFAKLWETIESGEIWEGMIENQRKDGSKYYVISHIGPIYYKNGKFREYIGIRTDVTEQEDVITSYSIHYTKLYETRDDQAPARDWDG